MPTLTRKLELSPEDRAAYAAKIAKIGLDRHDARMLFREIVERTGSMRIAEDCWIAARKLAAQD